MNKTEGEAYNLMEEMSLNNQQQSNERTPSKKVRCKFDVDDLTLYTTKMDVASQRLDRLNVNAVTTCAASCTCDSCGSFDHVILNCHIRKPFCLSSSE